MASIIREARWIASMPLEDEAAALVSAEDAHVDTILDLGHTAEVAEGLGASAVLWTRAAAAIIRQRGSLDVGPVN